MRFLSKLNDGLNATTIPTDHYSRQDSDSIQDHSLLELVKSIPRDPQDFYQDFGVLYHPRTGKPVPKLAPYQIELWKRGFSYKYRIVIKSNKIGLTTSSLLELFYHMITDCAGHEALVFAQKFEISKDHIRTLRRMIIQSDKYRPFLISHQEEGLLKDDVTKVSEIVLRNPYDRFKPSRVIGLGVAASSAVSWKQVKYILFSDITKSKQDYRETLDGALTRLSNSEGYFLIETIPGKIGDRVYELVQETKYGKSDSDTDIEIPPELSFSYMEIPAREAIAAGVIRQQWLDAQKDKLGKFFDKYYNCQFITEGGKVFPSHILEDIKILGKEYSYPRTFDPYSREYPKALGIDTGFGSSKTAIVGITFVDEKIVVTYSKEFIDADYNEMIALIANLYSDQYNSQYKTNIFIDGSNPEFTRTLRQTLGLDSDPYPKHKNAVRTEELTEFGRVIPVNFGLMGITMLSHLQHVGSEGVLAISEEKHPELITQLTIAEHRDHRLEKSPTISFDLLDALRLCLLNYEFLRE
jgi:hypothetical protein